MIAVRVIGTEMVAENLVEFGNALQSEFHFLRTGAGVPLHLDGEGRGAPFSAHRESGVVVSAWQHDGIAQYLGHAPGAHLLILSMLGLLQWRALMGNTVLRAEDFRQRARCGCLFEERSMQGGYVLLLEAPRVCRYCEHFYAALCPDAQISALHQVLRHAVGAAKDGCAA